MKKIRIVFADDHDIVRRGLRALFTSAKEFMVVGEATDGMAALDLIAKKKPDVAVLDISMPRMNGFEATKIIKERFPSVKILILTVHEDEAYVYQLLRAGANGYVLKNAEKNDILSGVRAVMADEAFFSPGVSNMMIKKFVEQSRAEL
jgi:two-component system response regulator DegU